MDWVVGSLPEAMVELRHEIVGYLRRHASPEADLQGADIALAELLTNATRHAPGPAWVSVDWSRRQPVVTINDLGPGFDLDASRSLPPVDAPGGRGLYIATELTDHLAVAAKRAGGSRTSARLAVTRPPQADYDPAPARSDALPTAEEADRDGTFGTTSFLRALVVHLAEAVELTQGPAAAEAAVAQVGATVGGRMEDEYRRARQLVESLPPDTIGDLYVRLKAAINGDFYVIEADDDKIVLGNNRCPFGDVVKKAPGLCRMTSSVFGGIAARNSESGEATVVLEERIAVGDPGCRVVVWLTEPPLEEAEIGHRYRRPRDADEEAPLKLPVA